MAARGIYLSLDRPDTTFASKEASRRMSGPTRADERKLKRLGRYLRGFPRVVQEFPWQEDGLEMRVDTDADWAGCSKTRKSTSGGVVMRGQHCLKFWAKTQTNITTSTAGAELVALVKGTCEAKGMVNVLHDLAGREAGKIGVYTDASAAIGMAQRRGSGKVRHIDCKDGSVEVNKVAGKANPAYIFTKGRFI